MASGEGSDATAAVLEEIIQIDPLDGEALMLLGQHYSKQGEPDRALLYFERAASLDAYEANAKVRQAQVLVSMGRYADAVPLLRRAQEIKPRDDINRYLEQVERIAKSRR
jgi:tetratricopeptide (TPR) repeat protein